MFNNNGSSITSDYTTSGTWGLSSTKFKSPPSSITDSPSGNYSGNANKSITTNTTISLTNAIYAHLQYYTRFEIEKNNDKAQVFISTNNGVSFVPLCGRYETSPASFGGTNPVYDGLQNGWVKEDIDLSNYIGQNIKLRFTFNSNFSTNKDGFYFDDLLIRKIDNNITQIKKEFFNENITLFPNPAKNVITIQSESELKNSNVQLLNALGQTVKSISIENTTTSINISDLNSGIYFVQLNYNNQKLIKKIIKE